MNDWRPHLEAMLRARRFDEVLIKRAALVEGVYHVSIGMEATAAALAVTRREGDTTMLNHRNHGVLAALGSDLQVMFREIFGRDGGPQRGRAGTLHLADPAVGVPYTSAMVGGGVALAVGTGFARRLRGGDGVVFAFLGDGAMGEGAVFEAFNLACLWEAPVLFVCENNSDPAPGRANSMQAAPKLVDLAAVHQMPATALDASDPGRLAEAFRVEVDAVRAGRGPRFVEAVSAPWPGNAGFMPSPDEPRFDVATAAGPGEGWAAVDPVTQQIRLLLAAGVDREAIEVIDREITAAVELAAESAAAAPSAPPDAAFENVWGSQ